MKQLLPPTPPLPPPPIIENGIPKLNTLQYQSPKNDEEQLSENNYQSLKDLII